MQVGRHAVRSGKSEGSVQGAGSLMLVTQGQGVEEYTLAGQVQRTGHMIGYPREVQGQPGFVDAQVFAGKVQLVQGAVGVDVAAQFALQGGQDAFQQGCGVTRLEAVQVQIGFQRLVLW